MKGGVIMDRQLPMTNDEKQLAEQYLHLVPQMVSALTRSYSNLSMDETEELTQAGYLALCRSAMNYRTGRPFAPYAKAAIRHAIYDYWRDCRRRSQRFCSLDAMLEKKSEPDFIRTVPSALGTASEAETRNQSGECSKFWHLLEEQNSGILKKGLIALRMQQQGYKSTDLAKVYGVPPNHIRAWQSKARKLLKENEELYALLA